MDDDYDCHTSTPSVGERKAKGRSQVQDTQEQELKQGWVVVTNIRRTVVSVVFTVNHTADGTCASALQPKPYRAHHTTPHHTTPHHTTSAPTHPPIHTHPPTHTHARTHNSNTTHTQPTHTTHTGLLLTMKYRKLHIHNHHTVCFL